MDERVAALINIINELMNLNIIYGDKDLFKNCIFGLFNS